MYETVFYTITQAKISAVSSLLLRMISEVQGHVLLTTLQTKIFIDILIRYFNAMVTVPNGMHICESSTFCFCTLLKLFRPDKNTDNTEIISWRNTLSKEVKKHFLKVHTSGLTLATL